MSEGISIDSSTGEITVADTATRSNLDTYTVLMTGTGLYKGSIETTVDIWVQAFNQNLEKWNVASSVIKKYMFSFSRAPIPSWYK